MPLELAPIDELRLSMEILADEVKTLILELPPRTLLGYLWSHMLLTTSQGDKESYNSETLQLAMEYVHATLSCFDTDEVKDSDFDESKATQFMEAISNLRNATVTYIIASSQNSADGEFGDKTAEVEFDAKSNWAFIRGNRYQVLEKEFFLFVLTPHDDALRDIYGATAEDIANGLQSITNSMREGHRTASELLQDKHAQTLAIAKAEGITMEDAIEIIRVKDKEANHEMEQATQDIFYGGICNLSTHTNLPENLLKDLSFTRGGNDEFFVPGEYCGTPMRTIPARIRPLIKLDDGYYATDMAFLRDSAYGAIKRGLIERLPAYREVWNSKQKELTESAFGTIFSEQLNNSAIYEEVYYRDIKTGNWVENDTLIIIDDVLIQVEAKAGNAAMFSPSTDFNNHVGAIQRLVIKAYSQTKRFLEYADSAQSVPLYKRENGAFVEILQLRLADYRLVLPIGLTVENFSPFSTMCKELSEIEPILGKHPFISMSIDDLFVLNRLLPTAGELMHYMDVRQSVAGQRGAMLFDEFDHLGAYISKNRIDQFINDQLTEGFDLLMLDQFSSSIDDYFSSNRWKTEEPPMQKFPSGLLGILSTLNVSRKKGWLKAEGLIRDLGEESRNKMDAILKKLFPTLNQHPYRYGVIGSHETIMLWLEREGGDDFKEIRTLKAEASAIIAERPYVNVLRLKIMPNGSYSQAWLEKVFSPSVVSANWTEVLAEVENIKKRIKLTV